MHTTCISQVWWLKTFYLKIRPASELKSVLTLCDNLQIDVLCTFDACWHFNKKYIKITFYQRFNGFFAIYLPFLLVYMYTRINDTSMVILLLWPPTCMRILQSGIPSHRISEARYCTPLFFFSFDLLCHCHKYFSAQSLMCKVVTFDVVIINEKIL